MTGAFWGGKFGSAYTRRNAAPKIGGLYANIHLFTKVLRRMEGVQSLVEFGAGDGKNLKAIHAINPNIQLHALEINEDAFSQIPGYVVAQMGDVTQVAAPIICDVALTKGLLIHIAPEDLPRTYNTLATAAGRYLMIAEYFSPKPEMIPYRGENDRLWKRDFAGEILDQHQNLRLIDYGWVYSRDPFPQDNLTWFLMEKR